MTLDSPASHSRNASQVLGLSGSGKRSLHVPGQVGPGGELPI